jgi:TonB family protein
MSEVLEFTHSLRSPAERRKHARQRPNSLTYIELDRENGGIVLDASANGISVQAVVGLADDVLPRVRLRLPDSKEWLEFRARVVWTRESRKVAGLEFEDLRDESRSQLEEWLAREAADKESQAPAAEEQAATAGSDTNDFTRSPDSNLAETRPAVGLVDYTDQSGSDEAHTVQAGAEVREQAPIPVLNTPQPAARILSAHFSDAQERAIPVAPERKQMARSPERQFAQTAAGPRQPRRADWVYVLFFVLAAGSLTAGWAAGRGNLAPIMKDMRGILGQEGAAATTETQAEQASAPIAKFEVIDVTGQRRTVSLGAAAAAVPAAAQWPRTDAPAQAVKPAMNFQIWTLSAPRRSVSSGAATVGANSAPPAMPAVNERTETPQIAQIASGGATNGYAMVPKPESYAGVVRRGALLHRVEPGYPEIARDQRIAGTVVLNAHIGADGAVRSIRLISGPTLLIPAAENAVRQWRYAPTFLDGTPVETDVQISLVFHLQGEPQ